MGLPNIYQKIRDTQELKDEIGWSEEITDQYLAAQLMRLCDYIGTLERRILDIEKGEDNDYKKV